MHESMTDVKGYLSWGAHIGIRSKRRDLAIIYSQTPAAAAAVFTRNVVKAEPVKLSRRHMENGRIQAIVVNSGNANACTGERGRRDAQMMADVTAEELGIPVEDVFVASTGLIGKPLPSKKVSEGIRTVASKLSGRKIAGKLTSNAILTTDTFAKEGYTSFSLRGNRIRMGGIAKGSGMIHPDMGTMLAFIICDMAISSELLQRALEEVTRDTFNMISVDGDTSTNDTVCVLCNGAAGNRKVTREGEAYDTFRRHLRKLCAHLARLIVSDGEGATKLVEYRVQGAPSDTAARRIARTISNSNLVRTAMFGRDPNWGRILAAAGRAGVGFDPERLDLSIGTSKGTVLIMKRGQPTDYDRTHAKRKMRASRIDVILDMHQGDGSATAWGSDFSYEYVRINAEYST